MKLLVIADFLNSNLLSIIQNEKPDLIITLGDLSENLLLDLKNIKIPKIGVYGNHCKGNYLENLNFINLHGRKEKINGISFAGFEGCLKYKESPFQYTESECSEKIKNLKNIDIFISHCPPKGINDDVSDEAHVGFQALRDFVDNESPKILFHGHTYPPKEQQISQYKNTIIYYVHGYEIIDLDNLPSNLTHSRGYCSNVINKQDSFW